MEHLKQLIGEAQENRSLLREEIVQQTTREVIRLLDSGQLYVAESAASGWKVNEWVKKAVVLYFPIQNIKPVEVGIFEYHDKIPLKHNYDRKGMCVVPLAVAHRGAYIAKGVMLAPSYVSIGTYVNEGTMVDTWVTVGSCARIGKHVHLSGDVGVRRALEPLQTAPVIVEDGALISSRYILVEGVCIGKEVVLRVNVVLTSSTKIISVTDSEPKELKGHIPERSVVIPGSYTKYFPAGDCQVPRVLTIGQCKASTDKKTSPNDALKEYEVFV